MLDRDSQRRRRALAWVRGFGRKDRPSGDVEVDFVIDLVSGGPLAVESFGKTKEAEENLGWPPSVYWYVGTVDGAFGESVLGEWNPPVSVATDNDHGSLLPFDSGAFAIDEPKVAIASSDPLEYVREHAANLTIWHGLMRERLSSCYASFADYVNGRPPTQPMTSEDHTLLTDDARLWRWEARVSKQRFRDVAGAPDGLVWRSEERRRLVEARLEDRFDAGGGPNLLVAQRVIAERSETPQGDHHEHVRLELVGREQEH